ncbi:MAG TPA: hypothetical protein VJG32_18085 [Anaerolineae bacterium]|nr:hypothetical protein [Anaerolineae bacterium]
MKRSELKNAALIAVCILLVLLIWFGFWYGLLGAADPVALRWMTTLMIGLSPFLLWLSYRMGVNRATDHVAGMREGINEVVKVANQVADIKGQTAQAIRPGPRAHLIPGRAPDAPAARFDNLIPSPAERAVIVKRQPDGDGSVVEM